MKKSEILKLPTSHEMENARDVFNPERFGFVEYGRGWATELPRLGQVVVAPITWDHVHLSAEGNPLDLLCKLQQQVWRFPDTDIVPTNILSIVENTGGVTLAAYNPEQGLTEEGWLSFLISLGSRSGVMVSHMLGVREELRGAKSLGFYMKLIQAHYALKTKHHAMEWTFDPMRGANARLNFEKLGSHVDHFTVDKYGRVRSELYGDVPTDRFTAHWDLTDSRVHNRVQSVHRGEYHSPTIEEVAELPLVTSENVQTVLSGAPERVRYQIPGDIDVLMEADQSRAIQWRVEMRQVLSELLSTSQVGVTDKLDPARGINLIHTDGRYRVVGLSSGISSKNERENYYIIELK